MVDISALQQLPAEIVKCLPSLPDMSSIRKMQEDVTMSFPSLVNLRGLSGSKVISFLSNCLPEQLLSKHYQNTLEVNNLLFTRLP